MPTRTPRHPPMPSNVASGRSKKNNSPDPGGRELKRSGTNHDATDHSSIECQALGAAEAYRHRDDIADNQRPLDPSPSHVAPGASAARTGIFRGT